MKKLTLPVLISVVLLTLYSCSGDSSGSSDGGGSSGSSIKISGVAHMSGSAFLDYDLKGSSSNLNNSSSSAQAVSSETGYGGYVNGSSDMEDWYVFTSSSDTTSYTVSFKLDDGVKIKAGKDASDLTTLSSSPYIISSSGRWYLRFYSDSSSASGNYWFNIERSSSTKSISALSESYNFVPGDIIVKLKSDTRKTASLTKEDSNSEDLINDSELSLKRKHDSFSLYTISSRNTLSISSDSDEDLKEKTLKKIEELKKREDIEFAEPNYIRKSNYIPNDYYYTHSPYMWNLKMINLPYAWDISMGEDVVVAVLDSGLISHEDLPSSRILKGYDFIDKDDNVEDPGDALEGIEYHGTHVTGIIGAEIDNTVGIMGVSPKVDIIPVRVMGTNGGTSEMIAEAIKFASGISNTSSTLPSKTASVINMSFGGEGFSNIENNAVIQAKNKGILLVASSGNSGQNRIIYPAGYDNVFAVSAVDYNGSVTSYSDYGTHIAVSAPGGDGSDSAYMIPGLGDSNRYVAMEGTSMAAPHVSGVFALMKSISSSITTSSVLSLLSSGKLTTDVNGSGFDIYSGYGLIDASKAVSSISGSSPYSNFIVRVKDEKGAIVYTSSGTMDKYGKFTFSTSSLDPGSYTVECGIDNNGDGDISDTGEIHGEQSVDITSSSVTASISLGF